MDTSKLFEIAAYTLPSLVTGGVAYYLFVEYFKDQKNTRKWLLMKENKKDALPLKLQAYERMALFLDRINPNKLLLRVAPMSDDKKLYEVFLIDHIEQELEHNITQQLYISDDCWNVILTAKNTVIQNIRKNANRDDVTNADTLRQTILSQLMEQESPTSLALNYLKKEVAEMI
ncbi:MAG: hypothetical protein QM535_16865 [Limnohabitans sp.]|nr:hypothetical protein [Limnohabitans sp.]